MDTSLTTVSKKLMTDSNQNTKGRPRIPEDEQLKPRFTLNLSDNDNELFEKAVEATGGKRSSLARQGVMSLTRRILNIPE
jgi:hypothetical protein